ncbi:MAG: hypothetical protein MJ182_07790 [Treponema sp.]|nr:hypothetical protein [Treponema sp.]
MKKYFLSIIYIFLSISAFCQGKIGLYQDMITTDNLRLRTSPHAGNKIITVMDKGTRVKIIEIEEKEETIDGITSNWVMVEVQDGAKDKDGKPIKYAVVGRCFGGYLKETKTVSHNPNYKNGNGTIIENTEDDKFFITKKKHQQKLKIGEMAKDRSIYKAIDKKEVLVDVKLGDSVNVEEFWILQSKEDSLHYTWMKVSYNGNTGFMYYGGPFYSNYLNKTIDVIADPYKNNQWEILETIQSNGKNWTVRKVYQTLSVFSKDDYVNVYERPGDTTSTVVAKLSSSYKNGNGQTNVTTEAITEEYETSYRERWVRISVEGNTGWISGKHLSAERGGPMYQIPEDCIAFDWGDAL